MEGAEAVRSPTEGLHCTKDGALVGGRISS